MQSSDERSMLEPSRAGLWSRGRLLALAAAVGSVVVNAVVMLSDRAPGFFERLPARLDSSDRPVARAVKEVPLPESDAGVHLALWAVTMVLVALVVWSRRSLLFGALGVLALSTVIEVAQGWVTQSRNTEPSDLVANVLGIVVGLAVMTVLRYGWWYVRRRERPPWAVNRPEER